MTLLFFDGFAQPTVAMKAGWSAPTCPSAVGRTGGLAIVPPWNGGLSVAFTPCTKVIVGTALYLPGSADLFNEASYTTLFGLGNADKSPQLVVNVAGSGALQLRLGASNAQIIATSAQSVTLAEWHYYEIEATLHDTTGTCVVRVDGVEWINYTGATRAYGTSTQFSNNRIAVYAQVRFEDMYVCDGLGAAPYNTFLGDVKVETLYPNGNGATSQYLGSDANSADNYLLVDENPANTSDYVGNAVVGERDLYTLTDLATTAGTVLAVQEVLYAQKTDAGAANVKTLARSAAGTVAASTAVPLSTTFGSVVGPVRAVDPDNAAWTLASVNALQAGVETA